MIVRMLDIFIIWFLFYKYESSRIYLNRERKVALAFREHAHLFYLFSATQWHKRQRLRFQKLVKCESKSLIEDSVLYERKII